MTKKKPTNKIKVVAITITVVIAASVAVMATLSTLADHFGIVETTQAIAGEVKSNAGEIVSINQYIKTNQAILENNQQWQQQQRTIYRLPQPPYEPPPPRRCWDIWQTDGKEYEVDCITWEWI